MKRLLAILILLAALLPAVAQVPTTQWWKPQEFKNVQGVMQTTFYTNFLTASNNFNVFSNSFIVLSNSYNTTSNSFTVISNSFTVISNSFNTYVATNTNSLAVTLTNYYVKKYTIKKWSIFAVDNTTPPFLVGTPESVGSSSSGTITFNNPTSTRGPSVYFPCTSTNSESWFSGREHFWSPGTDLEYRVQFDFLDFNTNTFSFRFFAGMTDVINSTSGTQVNTSNYFGNFVGFMYIPDLLAGQLLAVTCNGTTKQITPTGVLAGPVPTFYNLSFVSDDSNGYNKITFYNGFTPVATNTTGIPTNSGGVFCQKVVFKNKAGSFTPYGFNFYESYVEANR